jgi:hypothetical protein
VALFNDGPISGIVDLMNYETSILDVASTEGIDTSAKLQLAQDQIAEELLCFLLDADETMDRRTRGVQDIVVTEPLRRWHTFQTLALVFRDAYENQLNDRYQGKWKNYDQLQREAGRKYLQLGIGLTATPAPKPAAPQVTTETGTSRTGTFYFSIAWVTNSGAAGLCSEAAAIALTDATQAAVSCGAAPAGITGWNVYAGTEPDGLTLQNETPLGVTEAWIQPMPLAGGPAPTAGQTPDRWIVNDRRLRRG